MARKQMRVDQLISNNIYVDYEYICLWQLYSRKGDFMENKLKQIDERNSEPRDGQGAAQFTCDFSSSMQTIISLSNALPLIQCCTVRA